MARGTVVTSSDSEAGGSVVTSIGGIVAISLDSAEGNLDTLSDSVGSSVDCSVSALGKVITSDSVVGNSDSIHVHHNMATCSVP